ncbi:MAG: efflux RND transporter permease subunit [Clostridia bacterium]|nr:efflux RND transporter permease subunit [Clostridia bacterium]
MLAKFSVKKPFTVLVAVILILVLGYVSVGKMTPDLLPDLSFPYIVLFTTYIGASPEEVEATVTKPLEQAMSAVDHMKSVQSISAENYSTVYLTFEDGTDVDMASIDVQKAIGMLTPSWGESIGTPVMLELSTDLIPVTVAAVNCRDMDSLELSAFVRDTLLPKLEGVTGVASVTTSGLIVRQVEIVLDDDKIEALNERLFAAIDEEFEEATAELGEAREKVKEGQAQIDENREKLDEGQSQLDAGRSQANRKFGEAQSQLDEANEQLNALLDELYKNRDTLTAQLETAQSMRTQLIALKYTIQTLEAGKSLLDQSIAAIESDPALTDEQKQNYIDAIRTSEEYRTIADSLAQADEQLAAYGLSRDSIDDTIAQLDAAIPEMEQGLQSIDELIAQAESGKADVENGYAELNKQKQSVYAQLNSAQNKLNEGKLALEAGEKELEAGRLQLEQAEQAAAEQLAAAKDAANLKTILTKDMVAKLLQAQNFAMPAGYLDAGDMQWLVSVGDTIEDVAFLESVPLFSAGIDSLGTIVLGDLAHVQITDNSGATYAKINGENGVLLAFSKQSAYATATVSDNVEARFKELEGQYDGLTFTALMSQGEYIHMAISSVVENLLIGAALAILILFLFLRDLRPTLIVGISIPVSVLFALVLMYFSGVTMNIISMSGLAIGIGMLVDNSIVVIENIYRLRSEGVAVRTAAVQGVKEVAGAITASTLTTICVFVPILFVQGLTRQIFMDMVLTVTYSLLASLIIAMTVIPAMVTGVLRRPVKQQSVRREKVMAAFEKALRFVLNHRAIALLLALVILLGSAWLVIRRGFAYFPESGGKQVSVTVPLPEDTSFEDAVAIADEFMAAMYTVEGLSDTGGMLGNGIASIIGLTDSRNSAASELTVYALIDEKSGKSSLDIHDEIDAALGELGKRYPYTVAGMSTMSMSGTLSGDDVGITIYANDLSVLADVSERVSAALLTVDGIGEVKGGADKTTPTLHVSVDKAKAAERGLTVAETYLKLAALLKNSASSTSVASNTTSLDVTIISDSGVPHSKQALEDLTFTVTRLDQSVETVKLSEIATITETTTLASVNRLDQRRCLSVTGTLKDGYNITLVSRDVQKAVNAIDLPAGCSIVYDGQNETINSALKDLLWMLLLGILIIYLIMVAQFQSLLSPFIVIGTVPLAFAGGFLGLLITGSEVSIVAMIGFIMLVGIAVNNGIVLVDCANRLREEGMDKREAIVKATVIRLRPVLMTALTTILGLLPLAIGFGTGAEIVQPVAVVCIGGLTYATLMTAFIIPVLYDLLRRNAGASKKWFNRIAAEEAALKESSLPSE